MPGPLASARALEGMTAVIVNLNKRYKGHAGVRVIGLAVSASYGPSSRSPGSPSCAKATTLLR